MLGSLSEALVGPAAARAAHRQSLAGSGSVSAAVRHLQALAPARAGTDDGGPIFLLSAGWRSGSTLLQRIIMSDPGVLLWGEPYDECGLVQALAGAMRALRPGWPPEEYFHDGTPPHQLTGDWIANLFPSLDDWREGQRALFDRMFAEPARRAGARRWGIKEVRLGVEHCHYLRWLYPDARFVLLYRDPLEAWRSYARYGSNWYDTWPDEPVFTPQRFGRHWRRLMEGFLREGPALGALLVKYEDLVAGRFPLDELERHLGVRVDRSVLERKVGSSERGGEKVQVNALQRWLLRRAVGPVGPKLGYAL